MIRKSEVSLDSVADMSDLEIGAEVDAWTESEKHN